MINSPVNTMGLRSQDPATIAANVTSQNIAGLNLTGMDLASMDQTAVMSKQQT